MKRFTSTGAQQFFAVPDGVTNLHVVAIGGRGGRGSGPSSAPGGFGGVMTADLSVTPGEVLVVNVAGNGGDGGGGGQAGAEGAGGFNAGGAGGRSGDLALGRGGGGGGGMSDVRPAGGALLNGLIFAGGGAGAGGGANGGGGGNAASGGTLGGGNGATGAASGVNPGGLGASGAPASGFTLGPNGQPGALGAGAAGQGGAAMVSAGGGGGGGGGLIGGNGGVTGSGGGSNGGGGGAGSGGFNTTRAKNTSYVLDNTGVPSVTLTYELPVTPGGGTQGGTGGSGGGTQGGDDGSAGAERVQARSVGVRRRAARWAHRRNPGHHGHLSHQRGGADRVHGPRRAQRDPHQRGPMREAPLRAPRPVLHALRVDRHLLAQQRRRVQHVRLLGAPQRAQAVQRQVQAAGGHADGCREQQHRQRQLPDRDVGEVASPADGRALTRPAARTRAVPGATPGRAAGGRSSPRSWP